MSARTIQPRRDDQRSFEFTGWGGRRDGAGRPRKPGAKLRHAPRSALANRFPVHATLRAAPGVPNLRRGRAWEAVDAGIRSAEKDGFRVVHFSVQTNHLHLLVEAADAAALARGLQGLAIRIARGVNRAAGRRGKVWADRYHARVLKSPREVRHALAYVLQQARRHVDPTRGIIEPGWIDPRSSGRWFDGWREKRAPEPDAAVSPPRTWLLAEGWRRHGLIGVDEIPPAAWG
jgi:REP element-mobilizing transposase RayT